MIITATQKNTRQATRKVRLVANTVRKLPLADALRQLAILERKSSVVVMKTVRQAVANAMNNHGYTFDQLELKNILVTQGASLKRFRPVSRGRAHAILKRTSNITVELRAGEKQAEVTPKVEAAPKKAEKVEKTQ